MTYHRLKQHLAVIAALGIAMKTVTGQIIVPTANIGETTFLHAIDSVHESCELDVALLCHEEDLFLTYFFNSPMFTTLAIPSPQEETEEEENEEADIVASNLMDTTISISSPFISEDDESSTQNNMEAMDRFFTDLLGEIIKEPNAPTAETLSTAGSRLLTSETDPTRRRLTEHIVNLRDTAPAKITSLVIVEEAPLPRLFYGCQIDRCLWKRHQSRDLSMTCSAAIRTASSAFLAMYEAHEQKASQAMLVQDVTTAVAAMGTVFIFTTFFFFIFSIFILRKLFKKKNSLKHKIVRAVYEDPQIKHRISQLVGEDLGEMPRRLIRDENLGSAEAEMSCCTSGMDHFCAALPLMCIMTLLLYTCMYSPDIVMSFGVPALMIFSIYSCFVENDDEEEEEVKEKEAAFGRICAHDGEGLTVLMANGDTLTMCCCCGGTGLIMEDGSAVDCPSCSAGAAEVVEGVLVCMGVPPQQ